EVIAGKSLLAFRREEGEDEELSSKCFAWVQTYDEKPKRRLFEVLQSQGMQMNQQVDFLSDGGEDVRNVQLYLNPEAEHLLDWFHVTMRLTVLTQTAKGCAPQLFGWTCSLHKISHLGPSAASGRRLRGSGSEGRLALQSPF